MKSLSTFSIWIQLIILIILEIILNIDNIIFISIIINKLKKKYKIIILILTLFIKINFLLIFYLLINIKKTILIINKFNITSNNIILIFGGLFIFLKSIKDLININNKKKIKKNKLIIIQIIIINIIFSLDENITLIESIKNLKLIIIAMIITSPIIFLISNKLTYLVNKYKIIMVICLSFLLIIGLNLIFIGIQVK